MKHSKIFYFSIVVALAGFLFGFDTVVISGADQQLQDFWQSSDLFHGLVVMSTALWGTVVGAIFGSIPTNRLGRKRTLISIGALFFISAIGSALASDPYVFACLRFIGGLGIGISTVVAPSYVSEIAPPAQRGKLVALYQFNIVFGILMAYVSNYLLRDLGENAWRWMLGVEAIPAFVYSMLVLKVPESPRWLLEYRNDKQKAIEILRNIAPDTDIEKELAEIETEKSTEVARENIYMKKFRVPLMLAFFIAFFNQLSGINAFLYYAPRIFELAGLEKSASFLSSIGIGVINLTFTLIGISMIDKYGRKTLMYICSFGYIVSLSLVAFAFALKWEGMLVPLFFFLFIAAHAVGQGAVIWVFISEIFPTKLRAAGQAFGASVHWVLAAAIPALIPFLFGQIGPALVYVFFGLMMVWQLFWVMFKMPETKGQTLENLAAKLSK
ncbi:sugar porter family MFS transporter [Maribellus sp. CM-23]|uniref:sugar porter family MFS transporter n=1 Tax=Maribellus sp. CM-23 TaxID=2781026 RepID=UPI001F276271|nr:sugar porter family MFS transporter [Maribellus sp. CM-23]MCE4564511.1 sugar porter family MFS transporter [Maribellus sp. CM-23]